MQVCLWKAACIMLPPQRCAWQKQLLMLHSGLTEQLQLAEHQNTCGKRDHGPISVATQCPETEAAMLHSNASLGISVRQRIIRKSVQMAH